MKELLGQIFATCNPYVPRAQILYRLEQYQDCYNLYRDIVKNTTDEYEDERKANMSAVVANLAALNPVSISLTLFLDIWLKNNDKLYYSFFNSTLSVIKNYLIISEIFLNLNYAEREWKIIAILYLFFFLLIL